MSHSAKAVGWRAPAGAKITKAMLLTQLRAQRKLLFAISTELCDISERLGPLQLYRDHTTVMMAANRQLFATIEDLRRQNAELRAKSAPVLQPSRPESEQEIEASFRANLARAQRELA